VTGAAVDDNALGHEQARLLRAAITAAGIQREDLWLHYFSIGGEAGEYEMDAYLHHSLVLPRLQRDLPAHAANELIDRMAPPRAPYAADLPERRAPDAEGPDQDEPEEPEA